MSRQKKDPLAGTSEEAERAMVRYEHEKWRELCSVLLDAGAVTAGDLKMRTGDASTPGGRILNAIREWGSARTALGPS